MNKNGTEKTPQKTPQQINDEFDEGELALLKIRQWAVQKLMRELRDIWTAYHSRMAELEEARQTALAQCTQEDGKECPPATS